MWAAEDTYACARLEPSGRPQGWGGRHRCRRAAARPVIVPCGDGDDTTGPRGPASEVSYLNAGILPESGPLKNN